MTLPDLASKLEAFEKDGYFILENVLSPSRVAEIISALAPFERVKPMGRNVFEGELSQRVYSLIGKGVVFQRLAEEAAIVEALDALLMPSWLLSNMQSIRLHPGETPQPWHADDSFYPLPRPRLQRLAVSVIWALEDFTAENGATELLPGSHLWGTEHPDARPDVKAIPAVMPAGSALVFDGGLWHRGGANESRGTRLCISPQYCQPYLRQQESQLLILPAEAACEASPRVRSMVGYNIHPPFVGQVDGMHPLRLVDPEYRQKKSGDGRLASAILERPESDFTAATERFRSS